jgi:hypothetical protein
MARVGENMNKKEAQQLEDAQIAKFEQNKAQRDDAGLPVSFKRVINQCSGGGGGRGTQGYLSVFGKSGRDRGMRTGLFFA